MPSIQQLRYLNLQPAYQTKPPQLPKKKKFSTISTTVTLGIPKLSAKDAHSIMHDTAPLSLSLLCTGACACICVRRNNLLGCAPGNLDYTRPEARERERELESRELPGARIDGSRSSSSSRAGARFLLWWRAGGNQSWFVMPLRRARRPGRPRFSRYAHALYCLVNGEVWD